MRTLVITLVAAASLCGCQTPKGVRDTASQVTKMSTQLNARMTNYVDAQNAIRAKDVSRLAEMLSTSAPIARSNQDQFDILKLAVDSDAAAVVDAIRARQIGGTEIGAGSIVGQYRQKLQTEFGKDTFDDTPLKSVSKVSADIATTQSKIEMLKALGGFAEQVNEDIKSSTAKPQ